MATIELITVEQRFTPANAEYIDNDLITAFPRISAESMETLISNRPLYHADERGDAPDLRSAYVLRLSDFVFAMPTQVAAAITMFQKRDRASHALWMQRRRGKDAFNSLVTALAADSLEISVGDYLTSANNVCILIGTPGCSKTTTHQRSLARFQHGVLFHRTHATYQVVVITVSVEKGGSFESLAEALFKELVRHALATQVPFPWETGRVPSNHSGVLRAIKELLHMLNVSTVVVEELQHLFLGTAAMDRRVVAFLTTLINLAPTLFVFVGSWELVPLLALENRLARRSTGPGYFEFRRISDPLELHAFLTAMWPFQWTAKFHPLTPAISFEFGQQTMGVHDLVVKLYMLCQLEIIASEAGDNPRKLDPELIREVAAKHFTIIAPAIRMMRAGRKEDDRTLWDVEPVDTTEYVRRYQRHVMQGLRHGGLVTLVSIGPQPDPAPTPAAPGHFPYLHDSASSLAVAKPPEAAPSGPGAGQNEQSSTSQVDRVHPLRPTRSKSDAAIAARDREFEELDEKDFRRIAYFAMKAKRPVAQALAEAGLIRVFGAKSEGP